MKVNFAGSLLAGGDQGCGAIGDRWSGWWGREAQADGRHPASPLEVVIRPICVPLTTGGQYE
jgi:hypothetical protein